MIVNKYDAVAKAHKVVASCTTVGQLAAAYRFVRRAFKLMHGESPLASIEAECLINSKSLELGVIRRWSRPENERREQFIRLQEHRMWERYEGQKVSVNVDVKISV